MNQTFDVVVLGAGPAGCVTAIQLARIGYQVAVVGRPRRPPGWEGLSQRTVEGLHAAGCYSAVGALGPEVRRWASWNGKQASANRERIVDRGRFDATLRDDVAESGGALFDGSAGRYAETDAGWIVAVQRRDAAPLSLTADFLVEARGRQAPLRGARRVAGPASTALHRMLALPKAWQPMTAVESFADGWAWFAAEAGTRGALQIILSSETAEFPRRVELTAFYQSKLAALPELGRLLAAAKPIGPVTARTATTVLVSPIVGRQFIRVGDAAVTVDPLSGSGIFEAIGGALAAAPVVNTLLRHPDGSQLAIDYYRERAEDNFLRHSRIGRDFYQQEQRWSTSKFWQVRQTWPDDQPARQPSTSAEPQIVGRPVVKDDRITLDEVIVTADQPRGVWQVAGVPLVPLLRALREGVSTLDQAADRLQRSPGDVIVARQWLIHRRLTAPLPEPQPQPKP